MSLESYQPIEDFRFQISTFLLHRPNCLLLAGMFGNLSRADDERTLQQFPRSSIRGLNLDRISSIIEQGGTTADESQDSTQRRNTLLVESLQQVIDYDPELLHLPELSTHFVEYCIMQRSRAPVLRKILELWPLADGDAIRRAMEDCDQSNLRSLRRVLEDHLATRQVECPWPPCRKPARNVCSRCQGEQYCGRPHQKLHWKSLHKHLCTDAPRHVVDTSSRRLSAIQAAIDQADAGHVVEIPPGFYEGDSGDANVLSITKPIRLVGSDNKTHLAGDLKIVASTFPGDVVTLAGLTVEGIVVVEETNYKQIVLQSVRILCPTGRRANAVAVTCTGPILFNDCDIKGGSDGLVMMSRETQATIRETDISLAKCRGIFATPHFTIGPNVTVCNCGAYGIKARSGYKEEGVNDIQPGPLNSFGGAFFGL